MSESWGDDELKAAVDRYLYMARLEEERKPYSKREIYRELAARFGRTDKAFEFRMQNISAVLKEQGKPWVRGLLPAENVGVNVRPRIAAYLAEAIRGDQGTRKPGARYKAKLPAMRDWLIGVARLGGTVTYGQVMDAFGVDRFSLRHALKYLGRQAENLDEPIITALVVDKRTGRCSSGFAKEFGGRDDMSERESLREYWGSKDEPVTDKSATRDMEVRAARFVSVEARPEQAAFRRRVFLACKGRCVISGCDVERALDAAHKHDRDWRVGHNNAEDGLLLRKDLHALYDGGFLWFNDDGRVELHPTVEEHYGQFLGVRVVG